MVFSEGKKKPLLLRMYVLLLKGKRGLKLACKMKPNLKQET